MYNPFLVNFSTIFYCMFNFFNKYTNNHKLSRNYCSSIHIICCLFLPILKYYYNNDYYYKINVLISIGYFIFDSIYILLYNNYNVFNLCMLYHHIAISYLVSFDHNIYKTDTNLLLGEISNIPGNIIYYCIHSNNNKYLEKMKVIQIYSYFLFRVILISYVSFERFYYLLKNGYSLTPFITSFPVYLMGLIWSFKICCK